MTYLLSILAGFALLIAGAELLVRGASRLARIAGLSPLVIGLTVVAYGTSMPEFAVSVKASLSGSADIALGNVVGSNIFNVLFILGLSSLIVPLSVSKQLVRLDVPVMIAASLLLWAFAAGGRVGRFQGLVLFLLAVGYTVFLIRKGLRNGNGSSADPATKTDKGLRSIAWSIALVLAGLLLLVYGARLLVDGATALARHLGLSELLIGLTIVAAGTSLPEAATSVVAALRRERDIAVGNVVGSNIFNILAVLGASAAASPRGVAVSPAALLLDIPVMVAAAVFCLPFFFTGFRISRLEGFSFLFFYLAYVAYLIFSAGASSIASV
ncbi:MAG: calcium/sodium antiporter [Thermodesulfobacteriota bacterium]